MNDSNSNNTLVQLQQLGLIDANIIKNNSVNKTDSHASSPWFIQLFFGFSGILASVFFIGFLSLILEQVGALDSFIALLIIGLLLSGIGLALFKIERTRGSIFLNSLAFTISVAGQLYVMFALFSGEIEHPLNLWLFLLIQVFMTVIMPNFIYRLLSSIVALGCVVYLLGFYHAIELSFGLLALITIVTNLQRYELLQYVPVKWRLGAFDISKALTYASALWLIVISVYVVTAEYNDDFISNVFSYNYYLSQVLLILASLYAAKLILKRYQVKLLAKSSIFVFCAIVILGSITVYASGLLATSLIIVIAVANSQRLLLGIGIFALVSYIFWYYYQLDTSLLVKSGSMLIIGVVILLMRWLLVSRYSSDINTSSLSPALINEKVNNTDSEERPS